MKHYLFLRKLSPWGGYGGIDRHIFDWFRSVDYEKNKITLAATKDVYFERLKKNYLPVEPTEFPFTFDGNKLIRFYNFIKFLKKIRPDVVVFICGSFHGFSLIDFLAGFILAKTNIYAYQAVGAPIPYKHIGKKHIKTFFSVGFRWFKEILPNIIKGWLCKKILTASNEVKDRLVKWYYYPRHKTIAVFHGVDLNVFTPNIKIKLKMRKSFNISNDDIVIISTARLVKEKCIHRLINAFEILSKDFKNCWLIIAGKGPLQKELEELVASKLAKDRIKFLGYTEDIAPFLQMSDIFVLPSEVEGLSIAMLEAMATGLITVATKVPGPKEIIKNGVSGFLVERNERGVLHGLTKVLNLDDTQRRNLSSNARKYVNEHFEIKKRVKQALEIFGLN